MTQDDKPESPKFCSRGMDLNYGYCHEEDEDPCPEHESRRLKLFKTTDGAKWLWFGGKDGWQVTSFHPKDDPAIGWPRNGDARLFIEADVHDRLRKEFDHMVNTDLFIAKSNIALSAEVLLLREEGAKLYEAFLNLVNSISEPSFEDSRLRYREHQIDIKDLDKAKNFLSEFEKNKF